MRIAGLPTVSSVTIAGVSTSIGFEAQAALTMSSAAVIALFSESLAKIAVTCS
jgi:hypothetical protein